MEELAELINLFFINRFLADRFVEGICPLCGYEVIFDCTGLAYSPR